MRMTQQADGRIVVSDADEGKQNPDSTAAVTTWVMTPEQAALHARGIEVVPENPKERHPFAACSKGDRDAMRDMANEITKQIES